MKYEIDILKALADENRLKIFTLLLFTEVCVCKIEDYLGLKQANISKHMMKLRKLNMVESRKDSRWVHYRVCKTFVQEHQKLIDYLKNKALENEEIVSILKSLDVKTEFSSSCSCDHK
ncbi:ArsR/SmtB family transcription factor [Haloplasma contractile]|uniref:Transcriptional regulator ArsR family protein n=1 Tax=Haloplasma contractile SSD-17B TaxID=1033810 RepID=U2E9E8_9MOLU|nr:metalloregulator ArsR/SmtB family transcription factor [Haloplasma contractile]ERJ11476.1 Transcriptional regulator ArsR family protein [Haloplasma contractile SSD-17B]